MSDEPTDATEGAYPSDASDTPDIPLVLVPSPSHEELSWVLDTKLEDVKQTVEALESTVAALKATASEISRTLEGVATMLRTTTGVTLGNLALDTQRMVKRLHDEEFGPPLG